MRELRARRRTGSCLVRVQITARLIEALVEDEFLLPWDASDPAAVEDAVRKMLAIYASSVLDQPDDSGGQPVTA
jgi:hypothetical protein